MGELITVKPHVHRNFQERKKSNQVFNQKSFHQHNFQSDHGGIWGWEKTLIEHAKMKKSFKQK